jgi:hypothetical protein
LAVIGVVRTRSVQPYTLRAAGALASGPGTETPLLITAGLAGSMLAAETLMILLSVLPLGDSRRAVMLAIVVTLPGTVVQDMWRYVGFAPGRPDPSALKDGVWALFQFLLFGALWNSGHLNAWSATLAWGVAATIAAVVGFRQVRTRVNGQLVVLACGHRRSSLVAMMSPRGYASCRVVVRWRSR